MPTVIHWGDKEIFVNQADLLQTQATPIEIYQLNINDFHLELRELEESFDGMPKDATHTYEPPAILSGVTFARKLEIINDYTITFLPDSAWNVNIVGGNSNIADRVNPNNVSISSANSAGLQDAESLQIASFLGAIWVDTTSTITGTTFPRGTPGYPVNNMTDAVAIANRTKIPVFEIVTSMTLDATAQAAGTTFRTTRFGVTVTIDPAANVNNCTFENIGVTGTLDSNNRFYRCEVSNATSLEAELTDCGISGTLSLGGGLTQLINCHSNVAGGGPGQSPSIDLGVSGSDLLIRDYSGSITLENLDDNTANISIDMDSGRVIVDPDVIDGTITVRGIAEVVDNSTGSAVVQDATLTAVVGRISAIVGNKMITDPVTGIMTIYDVDGTTILYQGNLYEDAAGTQPYQGQGAERRELLE